MTKSEAYESMFAYGERAKRPRRSRADKTKNGIRRLREHSFTLQDAAHVTKLQAA